jgi:hypothetical protein
VYFSETVGIPGENTVTTEEFFAFVFMFAERLELLRLTTTVRTALAGDQPEVNVTEFVLVVFVVPARVPTWLHE